MAYTVQNVLQDVAAYVNQDPTLPEDTELQTFVRYIDQSQQEWGEAYDWDMLRRTSTGQGSLSTYFNKLLSHIYDVSTNPDTVYPVIKPEERFEKLTTDKYAYIMGDPVAGYTLTVNYASTASIHYDWKAFPTALATITDVPTCPSQEYLTKRTIAFVLESRSDTRFPQVRADAQLILNRLIANQDSSIGRRQVGLWTRKDGYIIGR